MVRSARWQTFCSAGLCSFWAAGGYWGPPAVRRDFVAPATAPCRVGGEERFRRRQMRAAAWDCCDVNITSVSTALIPDPPCRHCTPPSHPPSSHYYTHLIYQYPSTVDAHDQPNWQHVRNEDQNGITHSLEISGKPFAGLWYRSDDYFSPKTVFCFPFIEGYF